MKKKNVIQAIKFTIFSISAGVIQTAAFELLCYCTDWGYWIKYAIGLLLSVIWNFTFNRKFTFKSAANIPIAMAKVLGFYAVFAPLSSWLGKVAVDNQVNDQIVFFVTMLCNLVLEFLFCKFVVYRNQEDTLEPKK